jgi:hypothetical protein
MIFLKIPAIGWLLYIAVLLLTIFVYIGMQAYIYKTLCADS